MNKKKRNNKLNILIVLIAVVCLVAVFLIVTYNNRIAAVGGDNEVVFEVEEDMYGDDVIEKLYEEGLIQDATVSKIYLRLNNVDGIVAGKYLLNTNMSVAEIFETITDGSNIIREEATITIIPGDWAKEVAATIAEVTDYTADEIMAVWNDIDYICELIDEYDVLTEEILASEQCYLEGYLLPETFNIFVDSSIEDITERILGYSEEMYEEYAEAIASSGYSIHEIYTLASIIQFEANTYENMLLVSGVFHNRLNDGWRLQSSVTICYALYEYDSWADCETNSDIESNYNTYLYSGLPVGPICNPAESAISAALNPTETDYNYFIANPNTGEMYFAETYNEHLANINNYLN